MLYPTYQVEKARKGAQTKCLMVCTGGTADMDRNLTRQLIIFLDAQVTMPEVTGIDSLFAQRSIWAEPTACLLDN